MPFSVSIGDVIACAILVKNVTQSLKTGAGSSLVYQELLAEFEILDLSFLVLERSKLDDILEAKPILTAVIANCKRNIEQFLSKNEKFASHLKEGGSSSSLKVALRKFQWTLFRDEDVKELRQKIQLHLSTIDALLSMCQTAMVNNLARYATAQHQELAAQQLQNLENQTRIQEGISDTKANMSILHTGLRTLSDSVNFSRRRPSRSLRRRLKPLGSQPIAEAEFEKELAAGMHMATTKTIDTMPDEEKLERMNCADDTASLESIFENENLASPDHNPKSPYQLGSSSGSLYHHSTSVINQTRILNRNWKYLGAWFKVVTYKASRFRDFPDLPDLNHDQKQTVLDIMIITRIIRAGLRFTYGDLHGANPPSVSLYIPRILHNGDQIFEKMRCLPLREFVSFFREGKYYATDMDDGQMTLLSCAIALRRADIYRFLVDSGAKADAGVRCDFFYYPRYHHIGCDTSEPCDVFLRVMVGELWDRDTFYIGGRLWKAKGWSPTASVTKVLRRDFICDVNTGVDGYLSEFWHQYSNDYPNRIKEHGQDQAQILDQFEFWLEWGADPYKWLLKQRPTVEPPGFRVVRIDLTCIALVHGQLYPWLEILLRFGYSLLETIGSVMGFLDPLRSDDKDYREHSLTLIEDYEAEVYAALRDLGYNDQIIVDIMHGQAVPSHELSLQTSSIDFKAGVVTRFKELDSAEPTLVKRSARRYEDY